MSDCENCEYRLVANGKDMCARPEKERICVKILNREVKKHTPRIETPLMKSFDEWISCATCWYHSPGYCARRERKARWNPHKFVCSDYGATDKKFGQLKIYDFIEERPEPYYG